MRAGVGRHVAHHAGHRGEAQRERRRARRSRLPCPPACPSDRRAAAPSSRSAAPSSAPMMRPVLARTSSAASGLRFCGMIEEPVVKRVAKPQEADQRRGPDHDLLGKARQVHRGDRGRGQRLEHEIAVGRPRRGSSPPAGRSRAPSRSCRGRSGTRCRRAPRRRAGIRCSALARVGEAAAVARRPSRHRRAGGGRRSPAARSAGG